jgi:hypothetical protein
VLDAERGGRPSTLNNKKLKDISNSTLRSSSKSLRKLAKEKNIGLATSHKVVRENLQLFPYKVTAVQEMKPADHEKPFRYCEWFTNFIQMKTVILLMSPSLQMRPGSTSRVILTHKTHDCVRRGILMLCMKNLCITGNMKCELRYPDGAFLSLYSLKKQ